MSRLVVKWVGEGVLYRKKINDVGGDFKELNTGVLDRCSLDGSGWLKRMGV